MLRSVSMSLLLAAGIAYPVFAQEPENPDQQKEQEKPKYVPKDKIISAENKVSNDRIEKIQSLLQKYYDEHKNLEDSSVIDELKREIQATVPMVPAKKADERSLIAIKDSLQGKVDEKYDSSADEIKKKAESEAEKKYPLAKTGEEVKVFYKRGRSIYSFKGHFYGMGLGGKSVKLNSRTISFYDLIPESKSLFDKKINAELRSEFIGSKVREYMRIRSQYSEKLFAEEYAKIRKKNESLGYIFYKGSWLTAEKILNMYLPDKLKQYKIRAEKERLEKEAKEKAKREAGGNPEEDKNKENSDEEY